MPSETVKQRFRRIFYSGLTKIRTRRRSRRQYK
ncbi:glycosyl transferase family 1 [Neisseria meningitidis]|nr:glycosyl transferase family 1 [Neisseria meningitidis]